MLNADDAPFIKQPSYAVYAKMRVYCSWLERMLDDGMIKKKEPLEPSVMKRVVDGAINSLMTSNMFRKYLKNWSTDNEE